ncbi:DUF397 domain-containing protein [Actinomadura sp. WMMB 499]|uniref:DUF397 domain-containing protein n=1 Tax=Actinomadura sp. WMMB 499 TaxID=1219491 RepID=UPI00124663E7|nr:DUF397 domain-containing protein [Actinomadura sp. WMMB 499]QFG21531.1 DUF397 domain-containing protein [Actinomadura sp. WMMB 499]
MKDKPILNWRKSSHSGHSGGECVEVADLTPSITNRDLPNWRKSSHSDHHGGECVEVADLTPVIGVRDSKNPDGPKLALNRADWQALTDAIKTGAHDRS